ncbi:hypothetical protein JOD43_003807 [Pullulanibacillus pueri]|uniref:Uncharacterized protein n=1 Tax=Pullulanibacillus pueri TaxID=1437324 RepID=A0A8J2ZT77_9BACL|nr:hypothetical protein [Pullulanibacillus pueri]GGH76608.1 hypothetical protein GCM10007096_07290 [Pullulanibacillus pueri]
MKKIFRNVLNSLNAHLVYENRKLSLEAIHFVHCKRRFEVFMNKIKYDLVLMQNA